MQIIKGAKKIHITYQNLRSLIKFHSNLFFVIKYFIDRTTLVVIAI